MTSTGEHTLLYDPEIRTALEHVQIVIRFEDHAVGFAQMHFHMIRHVAKIGTNSYFRAVIPKSESNRVHGIMGNTKCVDVDITDRKGLASIDGFDAAEAFAESFGEDALERIHGGFGDVERSLPDAENLGEAIAVVGVLVGD